MIKPCCASLTDSSSMRRPRSSHSSMEKTRLMPVKLSQSQRHYNWNTLWHELASAK